MIKIMIVDDEYYFREALKISLPWTELGFEICGEAKNGKDALEKLADLNPDIIIVDINMPIMDGLEFAQKVRDAGNNCKMIILTGHSEFNYARQAVQLGVYNYILKPVDEEELKASLIEIKGIIEKEANIKIEFDYLRQQVKESIPLLKEKFLNELIQGSLIKSNNEIMNKMEYLNINMHSEHYQVVTIELDYEEEMKWNDEDKQLWKFAVSNISYEILAEQFTLDMCYDIDDRICIIIGRNDAQNNCDFNSLLGNRLELIRASVCKHLNFTVTIGVGSEKNDLFDIHVSYKESIVALKNKLTIGSNKVIPYSSVAEFELRGNFFTGEHRSQLLLNMRTADETEVRNIIKQVFAKMRDEGIHHEIFTVVCIEMIAVCMEYTVEVGLSIKDILPDSKFNIIGDIQSAKSIDDIENRVMSIFKYTLDMVKKNRNSKASKLIEEVKRYIKDNYQDSELTIDDIAKNLFINYTHLCFIFKRETGVTINEYLTEYRINKAKELFDSGDALVLDVATRVGYADANYFGKCFKKFFGLAPSKYIESISRN